MVPQMSIVCRVTWLVGQVVNGTMATIDTGCVGGRQEQARVSRDAGRRAVAVSPFVLLRMDELVGRVLDAVR